MLNLFDVFFYRLFILCTLDHLKNRRILRSKHHICGTVNGVYTSGENSKSFVVVLYFKFNFSTLRLAYPVSLHNLNLVRPAIQGVEIVKKSFSIICNLEIPLRKVFFAYR